MLFFVTDRYMPHLIENKNIIFINFAIARQTMFKVGTETVNVKLPRKAWGNPIIFGVLIHIPNDFIATKLDVMYGCSLSSLKLNHNFDTNHRVQEVIYPIKFDSLSDLERQRFEVGESVLAQTYFLNPNNKRFKNPYATGRRIVEGINKKAFVQTYNMLHKNKQNKTI